MKILCIMPVFNSENTLEKSITSIITQQYKDWELIVINNNSTDGTFQILKQYRNNPQINVIHNKTKLTVHSCVNKALHFYQNKNWDVYTVHHSFATSSPDRFKMVKEIFKHHPNNIATILPSQGKNWSLSKNPQYIIDKESSSYIKLKIKNLYSQKFFKVDINEFAIFFTKKIIEIMGGYDTSQLRPESEYMERLTAYCKLMGITDPYPYQFVKPEFRYTYNINFPFKEDKNFTDEDSNKAAMSKEIIRIKNYTSPSEFFVPFKFDK